MGKVEESAKEIAAQIEAAIREQEKTAIEAAVDETALRMRSYAEAISPVDTGEYSNSFAITKGVRDGLPTRTLSNTDPIAALIEFGTDRTPEFAVLAKTAAEFNGTAP